MFLYSRLQAGTCWVVLNIYPLEQSLRKLANMFGAISSNKENIIVFIAMLKSLRFTFDHEELVSNQQLQALESNMSYSATISCVMALENQDVFIKHIYIISTAQHALQTQI